MSSGASMTRLPTWRLRKRTAESDAAGSPAPGHGDADGLADAERHLQEGAALAREIGRP